MFQNIFEQIELDNVIYSDVNSPFIFLLQIHHSSLRAEKQSSARDNPPSAPEYRPHVALQDPRKVRNKNLVHFFLSEAKGKEEKPCIFSLPLGTLACWSR